MNNIEPECLQSDYTACMKSRRKPKCSIIVEKADFRIEHWRHAITAYVQPCSLQFFKVRGYVDNKAILSALLNQS